MPGRVRFHDSVEKCAKLHAASTTVSLVIAGPRIWACPASTAPLLPTRSLLCRVLQRCGSTAMLSSRDVLIVALGGPRDRVS